MSTLSHQDDDLIPGRRARVEFLCGEALCPIGSILLIATSNLQRILLKELHSLMGNVACSHRRRDIRDGASIELIREAPTGPLCLMVSDGPNLRVARQVEFRGTSYQPIRVDPSILLAMRLPTKRDSFGSTTELFTEARENVDESRLSRRRGFTSHLF